MGPDTPWWERMLIEMATDPTSSIGPAGMAVGPAKSAGGLLGRLLGGVADDMAAAASRMAANAARGRAFETAVLKALGVAGSGPKVRIPSLSGSARFRVPDALTDSALIEIKSGVTELKLTSQLDDFAKFAQETGRKFILVVQQGATISDDLLRLQKNGGVTILYAQVP